MMKTSKPFEPTDQAIYDKWRASVPFTNAQIADTLDQIAAEYESGSIRVMKHDEDHRIYIAKKLRHRATRVREGRLSTYDLGMALHRLVSICSLCGKTALYRYGSYGRCKTHKFDMPESVKSYRARRAQNEAIQDRAFDLMERERRVNDHKIDLRNAKKRHK